MLFLNECLNGSRHPYICVVVSYLACGRCNYVAVD